MNRRQVGAAWEAAARSFLEMESYEILAMNYYCKYGEIDIVARDLKEDYLAFIEVKYRSSDRYGQAEWAVTQNKQRTIMKCALCYLREQSLPEYGRYRYDVVAINGKSFHLIKNAFGGL